MTRPNQAGEPVSDAVADLRHCIAVASQSQPDWRETWEAALTALRASPSVPDGEGPEKALEDAAQYGVGFIVDGERVSPDRVTVCHGAHPAQGEAEGMREKVADQGCRVPPDGWWCSREPGHDGPCAARPTGLRETIIAIVSAHVHVNDQQTIVDGPAIADDVLALTGRAGPTTETGRMEP